MKLKPILPYIFAAVTVCVLLLNYSGLNAAEKLTADYLASHELESDEYTTADVHKVGGYFPEHIYLKFTGDGKYKADVNFGQWGYDVSGTYVIKNGKITLTIDDNTRDVLLNQWLKDEKPDRYNKYFLKNGVLVDDNDSIKYSRYLKFDDGTKFADTSTPVKGEGLQKKIDSVNVITMNKKKGITKNNVKLREKADANSKEKEYCKDPEMGPCTKYIPQGEEVVIIARTEKKMKVQKWENYWYYVQFPSTIGEGWVFGEFIDVK